jgi:hypothetical protein
LGFVLWEATQGEPAEGRIYVYSDRNDILGDDYAVKLGTIEEVMDDDRARKVIAKAIEKCFDHTTTVEAISDGNGGWVTLETDT